jgi:hypothetical protein
MPFPEWEAGMRITHDRLDDRNVHFVEQAADQTENSNETLVDTSLTFEGEADAEYWYIALISYSADTAADMHFAWDVPSGAGVRRFTQSLIEGAASGVNTGGDLIMRTPATTTEITAGGAGDGAFNLARDEGIITMGGTAGDVTLQFAQQASDAGDTIFRAQSRLIYQRIA